MDTVWHHQNYYKQTLMCNIMVNASNRQRPKETNDTDLFSMLRETVPTAAGAKQPRRSRLHPRHRGAARAGRGNSTGGRKEEASNAGGGGDDKDDDNNYSNNKTYIIYTKSNFNNNVIK